MSNSSKSDSSKKSKIKKAYLIDVGYSIKDGKTYVSFFVKGKKTAKLYFQHDPYFYSEIPKAEFDKVKSSISVVRRDGSVGKIKAIEIASLIVGLEKKEFAKIICEQPSDVPQIKQQIPFPCFEYNIPFAKRFIYDFQLTPLDVIVYEREGQLIKKIIRTEHSPISLTAMAFDIETYNPLGIPNQEKDPIVMVSYSGKNSGVITYKPSKHDFVKTVSNEKEMLEYFFEIVKNENPDVLVGYNSAQFDLPYIKTRVEKLKIPTNFSSYTSPLRFVNKGLIKGMKIEGRVHFDLFPVVKFFSFIGLIKTQSMSLDSVSEDVLGQKKVKVKKDEIWKEWDSGNIDHLAHYSLVDSDLTKKLNDKFIPIQMELSSVAKLPLFETSISTSGQLVENLLMFHASNRHELIPQKPGGDAINSRLEAPIQGAFVKLPEPGIYENIAVLDFRGLYPSIIISYNIDPYTLVTDKNSNDAKDCFQSPTDAFFSKSKQGLVPFVLDYLVEKRGKIKDEIKTVDKSSDAYVRLSARSHALKILANSICGDEPLLLQDPTGKIKIISASQFIDGKLSSEFIGETQLGDASGWKAASFKNNKVSFRKIKKIMRHPARKILKIILKSGREIKVTQDHSLFTLDSDGTIIPFSAKDLTEKSTIVVPKKVPVLPSTAQSNKINLIKELLEVPEDETSDLMLTIRLGQEAKNLPTQSEILSELEEIDSSSPTKLGSNLGLEYRAVSIQLHNLANSGFVNSKLRSTPPFMFSISESGKQYNKFLQSILPYLKYNQTDRRHFVMFNDIKAKLTEIDESFLSGFSIGPINGTKIPAVLTVDSHVARILGYYVSEGYSRKWKNQSGGMSYRSEVTNFDQEILSDMERCFLSLGVEIQRTKTTIVSNTKMSYLIFKYLFKCGSNAHQKTVPEFILNSPTDLKSEFLYAYYLGDGTYAPKQKMYKLTTVSRNLANSLSLLLLQLGIGDFNLTKDTDFYRVHIWEDLPFIGLNKNKVKNRHFNRSIPGSVISSEISALKNISYYYAKSKRISKQKLIEFYDLYSKKFGKSKKIENLLSILEGDLSLDQVKSIEILERSENVYDLSVEETENFIGGFGWTCLHNSFYGYLGYARSRWYSRSCAESVTAWGRKHISETIAFAEKSGFNVLYADTDSVFLLYKNKDDVIKFMNDINSSLPDKMELELEGFYTRGVFVSKRAQSSDGEDTGAKKKYALLGDDGRTKIRGFELVRRDWSSVAKDTQKAVLEAILKEGSKEKAAKIIRDVLIDLRSGKIPLDRLAISTQITKPLDQYDIVSPETAAAKKLAASGQVVEKGSIIAYVIGKSGKTISEKAIPLEMAKDYDYEYYQDNQILPAVMKIMKELGYDEYSLKVGGKQQSLDSFF